MATKTTTQANDPIRIVTLDELDRLARLSLPPGLTIDELDPRARLKARVAACQEIISQRAAARRAEVRS